MKKKIMVVDDDSDILVLLRTIFEQNGYEVLTVDNGKDCLHELERGFKGIVLIDLMMPFMDGFSTIKKIIQNGYEDNVVISVISANPYPDISEVQDIQQYIKAYIAKPFNVRELVNTVIHRNNS